MYQKAVKILEAAIGVRVNKKELLPPLPFSSTKVHSLLTDFKEVKEIDYSNNLDGEIEVKDCPQNPCFNFYGKKVLFTGPFLELNQKAEDLRFSLWGNQGFLYRYALYLLEKYHSVYNFHACALFDERRDTIYLIIGGAGSGKTVFLLRGIAKGLKIFSTETLHCRIKKETVEFYMGSLVDNIRFGTLIYNFPQFLPPQKSLPSAEIWEKKTALDLSSYKSPREKLVNPQNVFIIFPHVEEKRKDYYFNSHKNKDKAILMLFNNLSQKISETFLLYHQLPVTGLDEKEMASKRFRFIQTLVNHNSLKDIASVLTNPQECWKNFLE